MNNHKPTKRKVACPGCNRKQDYRKRHYALYREVGAQAWRQPPHHRIANQSLGMVA